MRKLVLLTALGTNVNLILQIIDYFSGLNRFSYNREAAAIRQTFADSVIDAVHLFCTGGVMAQGQEAQKTFYQEYPEVRVELIPLACDDIGCGDDDTNMRKVVYETVERLAGPDLIIASGGRKTITQRIMEAAIMHGCAGYFTITAPNEVERCADARFHTEKFNVIWSPAADFYREKRERIIRDEIGNTFRSLYLLPNWQIDRLRHDPFGVAPASKSDDLAWLTRLPKADLHCHLGGAYDLPLLKELAGILLDDLKVPEKQRGAIRQALEARLGTALTRLTADHLRSLAPDAVHCLANLGILYPDKKEKHIAHAVLVAALKEGQLADLVADGGRLPPIQDRLQWYMKCGELGGSSLLQSEGALRRAVSWLATASTSDGVRYLEIRFSPGNYTRAGLDIDQVVEIVQDEGERQSQDHKIRVNLLIMATRHKDEAEMRRHVEAAVRASKRTAGCRVTGFDLAGQEEENPPERFAEIFDPLHRHFIDTTIHAGEMDCQDKIWQAMYCLHAKRIGHGLKLIDNPRMMNYVRDWGIAVEMCPTSNRQTNGFRVFDGHDAGLVYPLKRYLDHGIVVTVNTDNPGISNTTASRELLMAARLTEGGLSRWDILRIVRNGFKAAFLPRNEKDRLLKEVDQQLFELLLKEL